MRLCNHLLHTCCTPFSQLMWLMCFPGSQLAAGACACWLVSWVMSAPCWTFSVCCRRFWPLSSIADLAASVTACSLARVCLASSKMTGRCRQIIAFGVFDLDHEAWSWQMQINAEVHAAKTIQDPIPSESPKTNSKIQNTTSVAQQHFVSKYNVRVYTTSFKYIYHTYIYICIREVWKYNLQSRPWDTIIAYQAYQSILKLSYSMQPKIHVFFSRRPMMWSLFTSK